MNLKIELDKEDIESVLKIIRKVDPHGIFLGELGKKIFDQANSQLNKMAQSNRSEEFEFIAKK